MRYLYIDALLDFLEENEKKFIRLFGSFNVNSAVTQVGVTAYRVPARQTVGGRKVGGRGSESDCNSAPKKPEQGR